MNKRFAPSLFSRLILLLAVSATLIAAYWVGTQVLEPVPVPFSVPAQRTVKFDVRADVSKNSVFTSLLPIGPAAVEPGVLGRTNPFLAPTIPSTTQHVP